MDYCFYIKPILRIPETLRQELVTYADGCPMNVNSYFTLGRHPGHASSSFRPGESTPNPVLRLFDLLDSLLPASDISAYTVNRLAGGGEVKEHTDATGTATSIGYECMRHTMVHVSLTDNGLRTEYRFRRDVRNLPDEEYMEPGHCYLFNNYALHSVHNRGQGIRTNLVVYYKDEQWKHKARLYRVLGINSPNY